ncbi:amidohydrolase, partial [candidate division KSB1 bacterium]|nr:amidohydrolase [candidate division KSB1 bacterium]
ISDPTRPLLALRADIDALPITEQTSIEYSSKNPGKMHACGHDVHTTILLGTAIILNQLKELLPFNLRFIFQPAEEPTPGGAIQMIQRGAIENVTAILALHVDSRLPVGKIGIKSGAQMASTDIFQIKIYGKGGHAAAPHLAIDPILIGAEIVNSLHHITSRNVDPVQPSVLTVSRFHAGTIANVIPGEAELWGTLRSFQPDLRAYLQTRLNEIVTAICQVHHATCEIDIKNGAPPVINDTRLYQLVDNAASEILGAQNIVQVSVPDMGAEDFAYYLEKVPGFFFRLGTRGRPGTDFPIHHPKFDVDETAIPVGIKAFVWSVLKFFENDNL